MESDLGMTPNSDGKVTDSTCPPYDGAAQGAHEDAGCQDGKVALRNIRKGAIDKIKKMKKALGEDVVKRRRMTQKATRSMGKLVDDKNEDIMKVESCPSCVSEVCAPTCDLTSSLLHFSPSYVAARVYTSMVDTCRRGATPLDREERHF